MDSQKERSPEEQSKILKQFWLYLWGTLIVMVPVTELMIYLRMENNPYEIHVRLAIAGFIAFFIGYFSVYGSKKIKCPFCQGLYFGSKALNVLKPNRGCVQCGK